MKKSSLRHIKDKVDSLNFYSWRFLKKLPLKILQREIQLLVLTSILFDDYRSEFPPYTILSIFIRKVVISGTNIWIELGCHSRVTFLENKFKNEKKSL